MNDILRLLTLVAATFALSACTTTPIEPPDGGFDDPNFERATKGRSGSPPPVVKNVGALQTELGMNRQPSDLGYREKPFNPCNFGMGDNCANQYLAVIHFQLLCRDSEGTVSQVPKLKPIIHPHITWSVAGQNGATTTDAQGFGHLAVVSERPLRGKRLVLRKGAQYVGVSVNDVNKLVLPRDWCG